ncbi:hypothetical protein [Flavobacterium sp. 2]|uniref:hypothetical protein n=1 Tax=Flavobacterium sp. 2 TaxID=308053 RepID=UPI003CF986B2
MDEFFCKTRVFWAISRILLTIFIFWSSFNMLERYPDSSDSPISMFIWVYAVCIAIVAINEFREEDSNRFFLFLVGLSSFAFALFLVYMTLGRLKPGYGILLFTTFVWLVLVGLKDILGNHFYITE